MDKIICYGAGREFVKYKGKIEEKYEIVYVSGETDPEIEGVTYIEPEQITNCEYDKIMITTERGIIPVYKHLTDDLGIKKEKLIFYLNEIERGQERYYGEYREDAFAEVILRTIGKESSDICYVEIGAYNPVFGSNTYHFYLEGAQGVLVEPNRYYTDILRFARPRDMVISKAVGESNGTTTFYSTRRPGLSTCIRPSGESEEQEILEEYKVEMTTINDVFAEIGKAPDLLSLDVEGLEYKILASLDFERFSPKVIIVEYITMYVDKEDDVVLIHDLLVRNNYRLIKSTGLNGIYLLFD